MIGKDYFHLLNQDWAFGYKCANAQTVPFRLRYLTVLKSAH